jgi:excisionase family DNA binding protein
MSRPRASGRDRGVATKVLTESFTASPDLLVERIADRVADRLTRAARPLLLSPPGSAAENIRVTVAKEIVVIASLDPYLTLKAAAEYGGVSVRWLRTALTDPMHPLPCYRPGGKGGKVLVRRSDFDAWMERFRAVGDVDLDAIVNEVLDDLA